MKKKFTKATIYISNSIWIFTLSFVIILLCIKKLTLDAHVEHQEFVIERRNEELILAKNRVNDLRRSISLDMEMNRNKAKLISSYFEGELHISNKRFKKPILYLLVVFNMNNINTKLLKYVNDFGLTCKEANLMVVIKGKESRRLKSKLHKLNLEIPITVSTLFSQEVNEPFVVLFSPKRNQYSSMLVTKYTFHYLPEILHEFMDYN